MFCEIDVADIAPAELAKLLSYDPETGRLVWLDRPDSMFASKGSAARWRSNFCGKAALTALNDQGYRTGSLLGRSYRAHRVAWAIVHGHWPSGEVDHINGARADNRIANLRDVPRSLNQRNAKMQSNNTSGVNGVGWVADRKMWRADMKIGNHYKFLGLFASKEAAASARKAANQRFGFTERHGSAA
jgi:hypothetical protein